MKEDIIQNLRINLSSFRKLRDLTQKKLSETSNIPRSTIAGLEAGEGNPSLQTLVKLADALQVRFEELLSKPRFLISKISKEDLPFKNISGGMATKYNLLPDSIKGMEIEKVVLQPRSRIKGVLHLEGTKEYCTCFEGTLEVNVDGEKYILNEGDLLAFPGNLPHSYFNSKDKICRYFSVICLANS